jgi:diguanylate cyclase (GGDEF)-like protein
LSVKLERVPWPLVLSPVAAALWFTFRPLRLPPDWLDVGLAAVHVLGAALGYVLIRRLRSSLLEAGWTLLSLQLLISLCSELTRNRSWDTWLQAALAVSGYLVLAAGVVRAHEMLHSQAERFRHREEQLRHDANHDKLTGLAHRAHFLDELAIRWHETDPAQLSTMAVLFIDLDAFKSVNDKHGHLVGDELLRIVGKRLRAAVREEDIVARVGGDEFAALLTGLTDDSVLDAVLERVHARLTRAAVVNGIPLVPRASIGVARGGAKHARAKDLLRAADAAMYAAKRAKLGRDPLAEAD